MNIHEFQELLKENNEYVPKRINENWLINNNLIEQFDLLVDKSFGTFEERIRHLMYRKGYCCVCGVRTRLNSKGTDFNKYCDSHKYSKRIGIKKEINIHAAYVEYLSGESLLSISKKFNISNVTLAKRFKENKLTLRTHKDNQKLQSHKWKNSLKKRYSYINHDNLNIDWILEQNKTKSISQIAIELNCSESTIQQLMRKHGEYANNNLFTSKEELLLKNILDEYNIKYIQNDRNIINPKELDFYLPEYKLGIEVNGIYWHSEKNGKDKNYHYNKYTKCEEQGIQLLQFWDFEINNKHDIVKSMILSKTKLTNKIMARKCKIVLPDIKEEQEFLNRNHIQEYIRSDYRIGLEYNNELVSIMTFCKSRYNKGYEWELLRYSTKINNTVIGGASKLFKNSLILFGLNSIISYSSNRYSVGNVYKQLGFKKENNTTPNYFYTKDYIILESRLKYQKHKLKDFDTYQEELTEWENMKIAGYDRIWDCGNLVWTFENGNT